MKVRDIFHRCIRDRDGNVVIGQPPNLPVKVAVGATLIALVVPDSFRIVPALTAFGASFTWAWLEIFDGTTPLRRVGGIIVMIGLLATGAYFIHMVVQP